STKRPSPPRPRQVSLDKEADSVRRELLIAVSAATIATAGVAACSNGSKSSGPTSSATASTSARPAPVAPGRLDSILLGAADVVTIMGVPDMHIEDQTQNPRPREALSSPECLGTFAPIMDSVYRDSGFTGVRGQRLHTYNTGHNIFEVYEAAVSF